MNHKPRILLFEDEEWQAKTIMNQLNLIRGIQVMDPVANYGELLDAIGSSKPDLIILDLHVDGLIDPRTTVIRQMIPTVKQKFPGVKILATTNFPDLIGPAQEAGADDVRRKFDLSSISTLRGIINRLVGPLTDDNPNRLTELEVRTLKLVASGKKNKEIAEEEHLTIHGVKRRIKTIYEKLNVTTRIEAVNTAREWGYEI